MCGWHDRDHLFCHIEPILKAGFIDIGEMLDGFLSIKVGDIKEHTFITCFFHFGVDCACHNVPWRQVFPFIILVHELLAVL